MPRLKSPAPFAKAILVQGSSTEFRCPEFIEGIEIQRREARTEFSEVFFEKTFSAAK